MKNYNAYLKKIIKNDPILKKDMEFESWLFELALNIVRIRKDKKYSQEKFAKKLGMSQSAVARIESGQNMKCSTIWKISDVLGVNLEIFGADKKIEEQKFESFCTSPNKTKETIGITAERVKYIIKNNTPFINFNFNAYAT